MTLANAIKNSVIYVEDVKVLLKIKSIAAYFNYSFIANDLLKQKTLIVTNFI